jgi:hypothetical protein
LDSENRSCPLSQKPVQKRFLPQKGVAFLWKAFLQKNFQAREKIPLSALAFGCSHALVAEGLIIRAGRFEPASIATRPADLSNDGPGLAITHRLKERRGRTHHSKKTERHSALPLHKNTRPAQFTPGRACGTFRLVGLLGPSLAT